MPRSFLLLLILLISSVLILACSPFVTNTPPLSPQPIHVAYTSTLRPFEKGLHQCALNHPEIGLITQEMSSTELESLKADLILWFGEPPQGTPSYTYSLGMEKIVMIAGAKVKLRNQNAAQLRNLYTRSSSPYQVWIYSKDNELQIIFNNALLGEESISSDALVAPNPAAMIEAITSDPMAIGFVPKSWLTGDIRTITIESDLETIFQQPILAITHSEPNGILHSYLVCLQNHRP